MTEDAALSVDEPAEADVSAPALPTERRPDGKFQVGHRRMGGRVAGKPSRGRALSIADIQSRADPLGKLCDVANGRRIKAAASPGEPATWIVPTLADQIAACRVLAAKLLPDLRSVEAKVENDRPPLILNIVRAPRTVDGKAE